VGIYFVVTQKLILNVQKARLRLIFVHASYLLRLFVKALERQKRHGCRWFQAEASLLLQTCSPKMNKDVYFWACLRVFFARAL